MIAVFDLHQGEIPAAGPTASEAMVRIELIVGIGMSDSLIGTCLSIWELSSNDDGMWQCENPFKEEIDIATTENITTSEQV